MNYFSRKICVALTLILATAVSASFPPQKGYSTSILDKPVFDMAHIAVDSAAFNNWLNTNYEKLSHEQMKGPREHFYYLIDSYVKHYYAKSTQIIPNQHDLIFETLFSWSEKLGAYGGSLVYNKLNSPDSAKQKPILTLPKEISLNLENDLFLITSEKQGWKFKIPYYFMIWRISDVRVDNGMRIQMVAFSTGSVKDKSQHGHSQATIMFMHTPDKSLSEVSQYWIKGLGLDGDTTKKSLDFQGKESVYSYDESMKLHKEITTWKEKTGVYTVVYLGIDGTYQWNRPHFIDFLHSISINTQ